MLKLLRPAALAVGALAAFGLLAGCTPVSQDLAKKAQIGAFQQTPPPTSAGQLPAVEVDSPGERVLVRSYAPLVRRYADQYGLDWRLVLAVMKAESGFSPDAESPAGASGLMQLMPFTSEEVGERLKIEDMAHPVGNIRGGVYYLRKLYDMFEGSPDADRVRLALAAYNAGPGRVYDAQGIAAYLDDDPRQWDAVKQALPLLSKRYYTLHQDVWVQGKPPVAGWFGGSQETVAYVDKVMDYYERYKGALN